MTCHGTGLRRFLLRKPTKSTLYGTGRLGRKIDMIKLKWSKSSIKQFMLQPRLCSRRFRIFSQ